VGRIQSGLGDWQDARGVKRRGEGESVGSVGGVGSVGSVGSEGSEGRRRKREGGGGRV